MIWGGSGYAVSFERSGDLQVTTTCLVVLDWTKIQRSMNIVCFIRVQFRNLHVSNLTRCVS